MTTRGKILIAIIVLAGLYFGINKLVFAGQVFVFLRDNFSVHFL